MTKALTKTAKKDELIRSIVDESEHVGMRVGSIFIDHEGRYYRVDSMKMEKNVDWETTKEQWVEKNPGERYSQYNLSDKDYVYRKDVHVHYSVNDIYSKEGEFKSYGSNLLFRDKSYFDKWVEINKAIYDE